MPDNIEADATGDVTTAATDESDANARTGYDVPAGESVVECDYCGRPFASDSLLALHHGHAHREALSEDERERFAETYEAETRALQRFRYKALAALVVLYFGVLMIYAVVI
jgi:hypothetical protein